MESSSSFKIGINLKINLDDKHIEKDKPDLKSKKEENQDIKIIKSKPDIKSNKQHKQDIKMIKTKPDMNEITYEEEKAALILGMTAIFTVWWIRYQDKIPPDKIPLDKIPLGQNPP